jgi:hypothetical protein
VAESQEERDKIIADDQQKDRERVAAEQRRLAEKARREGTQ